MGVASEYEVWPLVGVRVPANASVEPVLALHNPTDRVLQVTEVYSSGAWVGLQLPAGGASAPRAAWAVPPHATRDIVRLRLAPPPPPAPPLTADEGDEPRALTAYVRVKADVPGGALVVCVEARAAPAGEHAAPLHLHMRARGASDPALTARTPRLLGGSAQLCAARRSPALVSVWCAGAAAGGQQRHRRRAAGGGGARRALRARAARAAGPLRAASRARAQRYVTSHRGPGAGSRRSAVCVCAGGAAEGAAGARLALLRADLPPLSDFTDVADLTLDCKHLSDFPTVPLSK